MASDVIRLGSTATVCPINYRNWFILAANLREAVVKFIKTTTAEPRGSRIDRIITTDLGSEIEQLETTATICTIINFWNYSISAATVRTTVVWFVETTPGEPRVFRIDSFITTNMGPVIV